MQEPIRLGISGLGGFGQFALDAFAQMPEVRVVAVHDVDAERAARIGAAAGAAVCPTYADLVSHPEVEAVYLATPPSSHGPQVLEALRHGRHVFVEKPLAIRMEDAEAIQRLAAAAGLRVGINYVLRFNPIYRLARRIVKYELFGALRHMSLENDAADEPLPPGHWFWDPAVSGGIWVEHGVHFFDIAAHLAGAPGEIVHSRAWRRGEGGPVDRVLAMARFGDVPATFYHGFDKPRRIERTTFRLALDVGYLDVLGWMPVALEAEAILDEEGVETLTMMVSGGALAMGAGRIAPIRTQLELVEGYLSADRKTEGRWTAREVSHRVKLRVECPEGKMTVYARTIQAGIADFARSVRNSSYQPEVTLKDAAASLALAVAATRAQG